MPNDIGQPADPARRPGEQLGVPVGLPRHGRRKEAHLEGRHRTDAHGVRAEL